ANLNILLTSIASLTQSVNEIKTILNSSDMKSQLEIIKNSIDSLKHRFAIYKQNQNEFVTTIQCISSKHGIKIQCFEDILMTTTTTLENLLTSTSALQDTMNNMLFHIVMTIIFQMHYVNGFDLESQFQDRNYIYDFELGSKNQKNKRITHNYVNLFIKEFDIQFENT
ncbi:13668_t:CDS:2, partial [Racocetra persica]